MKQQDKLMQMDGEQLFHFFKKFEAQSIMKLISGKLVVNKLIFVPSCAPKIDQTNLFDSHFQVAFDHLERLRSSQQNYTWYEEEKKVKKVKKRSKSKENRA